MGGSGTGASTSGGRPVVGLPRDRSDRPAPSRGIGEEATMRHDVAVRCPPASSGESRVAQAGPSAQGTMADLPFATIVDAFRAVLAQHPERVAYQDRHRTVTYRDFERESNIVAHGLVDLPDQPIVLVAPVSVDSLVVLFGALKAGRLVAPIDPAGRRATGSKSPGSSRPSSSCPTTRRDSHSPRGARTPRA